MQLQENQKLYKMVYEKKKIQYMPLTRRLDASSLEARITYRQD